MTSSSATAEASVVSAPFAAAAAACAPVEATKAPQSLLSRCRTCGSSGARIGSSHAFLLAAHHSWMSLSAGKSTERESTEPEQASPHKGLASQMCSDLQDIFNGLHSLDGRMACLCMGGQALTRGMKMWRMARRRCWLVSMSRSPTRAPTHAGCAAVA